MGAEQWNQTESSLWNCRRSRSTAGHDLAQVGVARRPKAAMKAVVEKVAMVGRPVAIVAAAAMMVDAEGERVPLSHPPMSLALAFGVAVRAIGKTTAMRRPEWTEVESVTPTTTTTTTTD